MRLVEAIMYRRVQFNQSKQKDNHSKLGCRFFDAETMPKSQKNGHNAYLRLFTLLLAALPISSKIHAAEPVKYQGHESIYSSVQQYIKEKTSHYSIPAEIEVGKLDRRLRLIACDQPLTPFLRPGAKMSGTTSIGVKCNSETPWTAYLTANIHLYDKIAVASQPLPRGRLISAADFELVDREISTLSRGFYTEAKALYGMELKQTLKADTVITPAMVKQPLAIKRREGVTILASSGGLVIRARGEAMGDGAIGERIKVKNSSSKRVIEATIIRAGVVEIRL